MPSSLFTRSKELGHDRLPLTLLTQSGMKKMFAAKAIMAVAVFYWLHLFLYDQIRLERETTDGRLTRVTMKNVAPCNKDGILHSGSSGVGFSGEKIRTFEDNDNASDDVAFATSNSNAAEDAFPMDGMTAPKKSQCRQWAVVTTINPIGPSIVGVSNLRNWCLVIVGDTKTFDAEYEKLSASRKENVFYLSALYQKGLMAEKNKKRKRKLPLIEMLPFQSFARKNIGYLFAISRGALVIFDFDDDNILMPLEDGETVPPPFHHFEEVDDRGGSKRTMLLKFTKTDTTKVNSTRLGSKVKGTPAASASSPIAFNPYPFMGPSLPYSWPRGFPINQLQDNFEESKRITDLDGAAMEVASIGVIQSLCDGDPDNDAIFRMTWPNSTRFTFQRSKESLPLVVPSNAYSPYNAQATTHLYRAFWGLYLPITVPGRVTDIWRSYITQRIMKDLGLYVVFTPPKVKHERSAHDYISDFAAELDLYAKTTKLLEHLDRWSSEANALPERILSLWKSLYKHDYIERQDVMAVKEWLDFLRMIGYEFPSIVDDRRTIDVPRVQPTLNGQPYRSFPYFDSKHNQERVSKLSRRNGHFSQQLTPAITWSDRPDSAVVKLIMMTMDEWPLIKSWIIYHGEVVGFENLYILDSSTDRRCLSFLRYARDILGVNVLFDDVNLNQLGGVLSSIAAHISGSSDFIIKVDTDKFLAVFDEESNDFSTSIAEYLSGFANDSNHPLCFEHNSRVGYIAQSQAQKSVCEVNIHSPPEKFPTLIAEADNVFKGVFNSKLPFEDININLGGHVVSNLRGTTRFAVFHFHSRCVELEAQSAKQACERHNFISPEDSKDTAISKMLKHSKCSVKDICKTCNWDSFSGVSYHKMQFYTKWLACEELVREEYYGQTRTAHVGKQLAASKVSVALASTMKRSFEKFDL